MNNPFIHVSKTSGISYLTPQCSINKVIVEKLPIYGLDDEIEGKIAKEFISTKHLVAEIKIHAKELDIDLTKVEKYALPLLLQQQLETFDQTTEIGQCARRIIKKFGIRLGLLLLTLKLGEKENRDARKDWQDSHWDYWANIETVILGGGLTSGMIGELLVQHAQEVFAMAQVKPYQIIVFENAAHVGVMGSAKLISKPDSVNVVMDFGQTNIKRSVVKRKNREIYDMKQLPTLPSKHMEWEIEDEEEKQQEAIKLHQYLIQTVVDTYRSAEDGEEIDSEVIISIASYTVDGKLNEERGGYAKLSLLCHNYAECLSEEISGVLKRQMHVKFVHDGTAVAIYFSDYKNAVCLTLGTYLGVGFPDSLSI